MINQAENKVNFKLIRELLSYWEDWEQGNLSLMPVSMHLNKKREELSKELLIFGDFFYALSVEVTQANKFAYSRKDELANLMTGFIDRDGESLDID
jgi:hypothetical protein